MNLKILVTLPGATVWDKKNSMFKSLWQASKAVCLISSDFSSSSMLDEDNPPGNPNWGMASEKSLNSQIIYDFIKSAVRCTYWNDQGYENQWDFHDDCCWSVPLRTQTETELGKCNVIYTDIVWFEVVVNL